MTESDLLELEQTYTESKIQHTCVSWFRQTFPRIGSLMASFSNGGRRDGKSGAQMKYEGQVKGIADLGLFLSCSGKSNLFIEMKVPARKGRSAGRQSPEQKAWQELAETYNNVYVVCHGLMEFIEAVCTYLHIEHHQYKQDALRKYPQYLRKYPLYLR